MKKQKVVITGATGFVGSALCPYLNSKSHEVSAVIRSPQKTLNVKNQYIAHDFLNHKDWETALKGQDVLIHCLGLAHARNHTDQDYYDINTEITKKLAKEAIKSGVKRFVFMSTTLVYGFDSSPQTIDRDTPTHPKGAYGHSKVLAEEFLNDLQRTGDIEVVIVRSPVVYGPLAPGNISLLLKAIKLNLPFPFSGIQNQRSMIYLENLCHALELCTRHPKAPGHTFLVSDGETMSIETLIKGLANGLGKRPLLFPFPAPLLKQAVRLLKKEDVLNKLIGSFKLDISDIQKTLNWIPPISPEVGLARTALPRLE